MIRHLLLILSLICLAPPAQAMSFDEARHLLSRTGYGLAKPSEIGDLAQLTYEQGVDRLLAGVVSEARTPPPAWIHELPETAKARKTWTAEQKKKFNETRRRQASELKQWWVTEMLTTASPLTERMTLFWHNHFVSSLKKVRWAGFMYNQNRLLRTHALGHFGDLLKAVTEDPAMLIYLDGQKNKAGQANENFAREVMELFTLGEGASYREADVREAARAFTGWGVNFETGKTVYRDKFHDHGPKHFLGQSDNFNSAQILDILLAEPQLATFIAGKLWMEFVGTLPADATIRDLALRFRSSGLEVRSLLRAILMSDEFRSPENRGRMIKSPVDLVIGTVRFFDREDIAAERMVKLLRNFGQDLLDPPNVRGWPGGTSWITTQTLSQRTNFLRQVARGLRDGKEGAMAMAPVPASGPATGMPESRYPRQDLLLPLLPVQGDGPQSGSDTERAGQLILDPVFQLK